MKRRNGCDRETKPLKEPKASIMRQLEEDSRCVCVSEFLEERLYLVTCKEWTPCSSEEVHFFSTDHDSLYDDFGPPSVSEVAKYMGALRDKLHSFRTVVHLTSKDDITRLNAAFLIGIFAVVNVGMTPVEVFTELSFRDYPYRSFESVRLIDYFFAVREAVRYGLVDFVDFNIDEFERLDDTDDGDVSWVVPQRLLAFKGPVTNPTKGYHHTPQTYLEYFLQNDVRSVVRLCCKNYDASMFTNAGLNLSELYFQDGTVPSQEILKRFLEVAENSPGAVAVHCRAGLGRTGCVIAAYLVKHYRLTAREAVAWTRICRPYSVSNRQLIWLQEIEQDLWKSGAEYRKSHLYGKYPSHQRGIYSFGISNEHALP